MQKKYSVHDTFEVQTSPLRTGIHATKRDLFYIDVKLFQQQSKSDDVLNDVAYMVGCARNSLNVVTSDKGGASANSVSNYCRSLDPQRRWF